MLGKVFPNSTRNRVIFVDHVLFKFHPLSRVRRFFSSFSLVHILDRLIFNRGKLKGKIPLEKD